MYTSGLSVWLEIPRVFRISEGIELLCPRSSQGMLAQSEVRRRMCCMLGWMSQVMSLAVIGMSHMGHIYQQEGVRAWLAKFTISLSRISLCRKITRPRFLHP